MSIIKQTRDRMETPPLPDISCHYIEMFFFLVNCSFCNAFGQFGIVTSVKFSCCIHGNKHICICMCVYVCMRARMFIYIFRWYSNWICRWQLQLGQIMAWDHVSNHMFQFYIFWTGDISVILSTRQSTCWWNAWHQSNYLVEGLHWCNYVTSWHFH